jgi:AAA ATPase domain
MAEGAEILRFTRAVERWGFRAAPPFHIEPPIGDARQLARLFTGRRAELSRAILPLFNGRNILVRGMLGVGKSAFILRLLHELDAQAKAARDRLLPIYIYHFYGGATEDFYRLIVLVLAQILSDKDKEAQAVLDALRGWKISSSRSRGVGAKFGVQVCELAKAEISLEAKDEIKREIASFNPFDFLELFVERACKRFGRLVIAVDDLDKSKPENLRLVQAMLQGALPLLRNSRIGFILTGITLPLAHLATFDLYGAMLGLFDETVQLNVLLTEELREIAMKTLNLVRKIEQASSLPLHEDALAAAAARSHGIPRLFNIICAKLLEQAVLQDIDFIDGTAFTRCYEAIQASISATVTPQMRAVLTVAKNYGGFASEMSDEALDRLGVTTFVELIPLADYLVANDLMVRQEYEGGVRYAVADIAEKAAEG